ncbi:MAG: hypothetical protein ACREPX_06660 [Rhodanobacteraceae bacterium]
MPCSLEQAVGIVTNGVGSTAPFLTTTMSLQRWMMNTRPLPSSGAWMPIGSENSVEASGNRCSVIPSGMPAELTMGAIATHPRSPNINWRMRTFHPAKKALRAF